MGDNFKRYGYVYTETKLYFVIMISPTGFPTKRQPCSKIKKDMTDLQRDDKEGKIMKNIEL